MEYSSEFGDYDVDSIENPLAYYMDLNAPEYLREESYTVSWEQTLAWFKNVKDRCY